MLVGEDEQKFVVHKNIICKSSDFFRSACSGEWLEAQEKTVRLPERDPISFGVYLGWLYTSEIDARDENVGDVSTPGLTYSADMPDGEYDALIGRLIDVYSLGDMLQDDGFRNAVVDDIIRFSEATNSLPSGLWIHGIWDLVPRRSKLARLLVDYYAADYTCFSEDVEKIPESFVREIAKVCVEERAMLLDKRKPRNRPKCFYHDHKSKTDECA